MEVRELRGVEYDRYIKVLDIITQLNKQHRQGEDQVFDCGELGFVHLWWHSRWSWEWIKISTEFKEN